MRTEFWLGNLKAKENLEDLGIGGTIVVKCIRKEGERMCAGLGTAAGFCEDSYELSVLYKTANFLSS
jgi:hypothetical protein